MRILLASDLHYRLPQLDWLVETAPSVDVVALPGDHLDVASAVPLPAQIVVVKQYLERLAAIVPVLASSGNHDLDGPGPEDEQIAGWLRRLRIPGLTVDGEDIDLDGTRFTVCPWWDGPRTRDRVDAQLAAAALARPARWVWLYHSPPDGTGLCWTGRRAYPDLDLNGWIEQHQPDLVLCGHIHQAPWADGGAWAAQVGSTWVFNPGHQPGPQPAHVVIDTGAATAVWLGLPDHDEVSLGSLSSLPA